MPGNITLRPPTTLPLPQPSSFDPPSPNWLAGTWHVTHSTLPMWKSKRNVTISYNPIPHPDASSPIQKLEDIVSYQPLDSNKQKTVIGIDTVGNSTGEWSWRGKGWLKIASSHWEVLGWGDLEGGGQWAVTYFAKTMFTPAGIDIYARAKEGHEEGVIEGIKEALKGIEDERVKSLAGELFQVKRE